MSPAGLASLMMIVSGAAHAVVNGVLKSGDDKMSSRALIDGFSALITLPGVFLLPLPHHAWQYLAASGAIHLVYLTSLIKAFERADMLVAYPLMRGLAPMLASLVAVTLFREPITAMIGAGVACVSVGLMVAALGRHLDRRALGWSLLTGASIALYTVADAQGVRAAPSAPSYIVWIFLIDGGLIAALFALWRGPRFILSARSEWRGGGGGGRWSPTAWRSGRSASATSRAWRRSAKPRCCSA
jgi:drug/metabolite transporter (DMT)-like permease